MPKYCKKCGYVFGEGRVPKLVQKGLCPTCKSKLFETKESISYFQGRVEKSMPTWEEVLRNKYLKNIELDISLSNINKNNEQEHYQHELNKLKGNNIETHNTKPTITCPYCHSTNTKKITNMSKAGSVALFGVFAMGKVIKQWKCNSCNSEF